MFYNFVQDPPVNGYKKHIERIVTLWEDLSSKFPDWSLSILGDGPEKRSLETYCAERNIERIRFEGICDPDPYYAKASILLLTSDFEGFPLVLPEAMSYGAVPVVYRGFLALADIIKDSQNGMIVEPDKDNRFSMANFTVKMVELITNETHLGQLSKNAIETSKIFSIDKIYEEWSNLLLSIT
jgi:glycosyltransferase involved in cell wall biosynthesis